MADAREFRRREDGLTAHLERKCLVICRREYPREHRIVGVDGKPRAGGNDIGR